jgi:hypothetical protein
LPARRSPDASMLALATVTPMMIGIAQPPKTMPVHR